MVKKNDLCKVLTDQHLVTDESFVSKECFMVELAFQMQLMGKKNLFIGNEQVEAEFIEESGNLYGFNDMLAQRSKRFFKKGR